VIHSNANLGIHGQGVLNLSGQGDTIEAQRLILSLFYNIVVHENPFCFCSFTIYLKLFYLYLTACPLCLS
jgi:hypothetical protein